MKTKKQELLNEKSVLPIFIFLEEDDELYYHFRDPTCVQALHFIRKTIVKYS